MKERILLLLISLLFNINSTTAQNEKKDKKPAIKKYSDVITDKAQTDTGLITFHKVDAKYYFEIPNEILDKEILIVSRISGHTKGLNFGGAGMKSRPQQVIRLQKKDNNIILRSVSYNAVADEDLPIYQSVKNNNFEPVIHSFKIEAFGRDSASYVVDIKNFFTTDVAMIGALTEKQRGDFKVKKVDQTRSMIDWVKSFPGNVEVRHILTYTGTNLPSNQLTNSLSVEMNQSMILLPEKPMVPRLHDNRVGFFSVEQIDYGLDAQKAESRKFITKWRLEPSDWEAFNRGQAVEPVKPIRYYIDPATPEKWRPYIKQGVEDWQSAFEKAGLKNAIVALDPPSKEEDPEWSPEDVRYSVIRYITTDIQNAQGPHVHDPRTGEILESDILWYHNVMNLLRNWHFVQTSAVKPDARSVKFEDDLMGELIRFVSAHEVGHTLGLPHNMGSSSAYPVDSLRSPTFTATHGTAPSIMDYARFNYIAQPGDGVTNFYPKIGEYDDWSIWYGYRPIPEISSPEEEEEILNDWIKEKGDDPQYRFGRTRRNPPDPSSQTEDLGDDSMRASELGIQNLQRIINNLIEWTTEEGRDYEDLAELYNQVIGQFRRYAGHVTANIGGIYEVYKTADQEGLVYTHAPKSKQQRAVRFLNQYLFNTPTWLIEGDILGRIQDGGFVDRIKRLQVRHLDLIFAEDRLKRVIDNQAINGNEAYSIEALFTDLRTGIFSELNEKRAIDAYRRNLQKAFVEGLGQLVLSEESSIRTSDIPSLARGHLTTLSRSVKSAIKGQTDSITRYHLEDLVKRIDLVLDPD